MAPRLIVACWRIKGDPDKRLATGAWQDGEPTPAELAEYRRFGWDIEFAYFDPEAAPATKGGRA